MEKKWHPICFVMANTLERLTSDVLEVMKFAAVASCWSVIHFAIRLSTPHLSPCQIGRCSWLFLTGLHCYIKKEKKSNQPPSHLISQLTRFNNSMSESELWSARQPCTNNYTKQRCPQKPVLWHPIRERWINAPACMKDLCERNVCRVNIAVGLRACVQNNYMLHCCDKNGPRQELFAANLAWEVPNGGREKSHWILYVSSCTFPAGCRLSVAQSITCSRSKWLTGAGHWL